MSSQDVNSQLTPRRGRTNDANTPNEDNGSTGCCSAVRDAFTSCCPSTPYNNLRESCSSNINRTDIEMTPNPPKTVTKQPDKTSNEKGCVTTEQSKNTANCPAVKNKAPVKTTERSPLKPFIQPREAISAEICAPRSSRPKITESLQPDKTSDEKDCVPTEEPKNTVHYPAVKREAPLKLTGQSPLKPLSPTPLKPFGTLPEVISAEICPPRSSRPKITDAEQPDKTSDEKEFVPTEQPKTTANYSAVKRKATLNPTGQSPLKPRSLAPPKPFRRLRQAKSQEHFASVAPKSTLGSLHEFYKSDYSMEVDAMPLSREEVDNIWRPWGNIRIVEAVLKKTSRFAAVRITPVEDVQPISEFETWRNWRKLQEELEIGVKEELDEAAAADSPFNTSLRDSVRTVKEFEPEVDSEPNVESDPTTGGTDP